MTRALLIALLALALLAGLQTWRLSGWKTRAATAEAMAAGYARTAELRAESDRRQQALREAATRLDHDLSMGEGADAPLSDYLRDAAGRLWQ